MEKLEKATSILSNEHKEILKVITALDKKCSSLESSNGLSKEDKIFFTKAVDFIKNYADKFHHAKEEEILFKELKKDSIPTHCNLVDQMLYEHDLGRNFVKGIKEGLRKNNKEKVLENVIGYTGLLQEHIFKEDNILYPMADSILSQQTQKLILQKFKQAENKRFPKGTKKKYLMIANNITN